MENLKQNNLAEATTELGFVQTLNENAGETVVALEREVELENGERVMVAGITPEKMKALLNNGADPEKVTFKTPGENHNEEIKGVCQAYNSTLTETEEEIPEEPGDSGENPDEPIDNGENPEDNGEGTETDPTEEDEGEQTPAEEL